MKKMKKLMAALLAMVMMLAMTTTAFAAKTGASITVRGLSTSTAETAGKQKVDIYEIYRLDDNNNAWVKAAWVPEDVTPTNLAEKAGDLQLAANDTTAVATKETTTGTVTFTESKDGEKLQAGAYLVLATDESTKVEYSPMIAVTYEYGKDGLIAGKVADVVAKAETYKTDKEQVDKDEVVEVGDLIEYKITTTVPYNDGKLETFTLTDILTGATYYLTGDAVKGVNPVNEVTVGGAKVDGIEIPANAQGKNTFTMDMSSLLTENNAYAGQEVVVKYTVKVEAVDSVTNKATSSNDSVGNTTTTYTGTATITKYGDNKQTLEGAKFVLYRENKDGEKEYAKIDNEYVTGEWTKDEAQATLVTTNNKGVATVKGLDVGTYYFKEVVAPDGYTINETPSKVEITKEEVNGKVTVSGTTEMTDTKLASLPGTGGIGTTIFTIGGCIIMIAAAAFYFLSRKKENN